MNPAAAIAGGMAVLLAGSCSPRPSNTAPDPHRPAEVNAPEAGGEVRRLLDGLSPGDTLAGCWRVSHVRAASDGIQIEVQRGGDSLTLTVARAGKLPFRAPRAVGALELFYGELRPSDAGLPNADREELLGALADRVQRGATNGLPAGL